MEYNFNLTNEARKVTAEDYTALINGYEPMLYNNESEFRDNLITYLHDIIDKLKLPEILSIKKNYSIGSTGPGCKGGVRVDIYIKHKDLTATIIECKYSKDISFGERAVNQAHGIGQLLWYNEAHKELYNVTARLFLADERPNEQILNVAKNLNIGLIFIKGNRIFTVNPY